MSSDFWCRIHDCEADSMGMCCKCYQMLNKRQQCYQVQIEVSANDPGLGGVRKAAAVDAKEKAMSGDLADHEQHAAERETGEAQ